MPFSVPDSAKIPTVPIENGTKEYVFEENMAFSQPHRFSFLKAERNYKGTTIRDGSES
jgi:hypothetical protein